MGSPWGAILEAYQKEPEVSPPESPKDPIVVIVEQVVETPKVPRKRGPKAAQDNKKN